MSTENMLDEKELEVKTEPKLAGDSSDFDIKKIKNVLSGIEEKYNSQYPESEPDESTMPQYKDSTPKDYSDIVDDAKNLLGDYEISNKKSISKNFDEKFEQINQKEENILREAEREEQGLNSGKVLALEENKANMIAQGLERSSIADNTTKSISDTFDSDLLALIDEKQASLSELELKRSMIQNDLESALEKFDIAYAAKLEKKIEELTKKYDEDMLNLEKYNLKIAELRNARSQEWAKWVKQKSSEIEATKSRKKVEYLVNIIKNLSKSEAQELMRDQDIINSLGEYYQIVLDFANSRR